MQPRAYSVFHLNLAFSSIAEEDRPEVVERCYHPLLDLVETAGLPLGIELAGWTLLQMKEIDPGWVERFKGLLGAGRCELIGSGRTQLIGPLVPHPVNVWNQRLGLETYERVLGVRPRIALVNEMAYSSSLVDLYAEAGYEGFIMDRDNVRLALGIEAQPMADTPTHAVGVDGAVLPVLWSDSILFQKLQHFAHGDIREADYLGYLHGRVDADEQLLPLYMNDAEVFDYRPGRFGSESRLHPEGEWNRIERLWVAATEQENLLWSLPSESLSSVSAHNEASLVGAAHPIPVKKQAKYNLGRWAVTGRNDTWINTMCHRLSQHLVASGDDDPERWGRLCDLWATDLRTHITEARWEHACSDMTELAEELGVALDYGKHALSPGESEPPNIDGFEVNIDAEGIMLNVATPHLRMALNLRRGLTISSLAFASHDFEPIIGTLPHGFFSGIDLGADFYTGGVVVDLPAEHRRITDLERVDPLFRQVDADLLISVEVATPLGPIAKTVRISADSESIEIGYEFPGWERPMGTIRAGTITLLPGGFSEPIEIQCANGGAIGESFALDAPVDHAQATSNLISSTAGLGATDGEVAIGHAGRRVVASWDPGKGAVLPMVIHRPSHPDALTRVLFSLQEVDDTSRPGGVVGGFSLSIRSSP